MGSALSYTKLDRHYSFAWQRLDDQAGLASLTLTF